MVPDRQHWFTLSVPEQERMNQLAAEYCRPLSSLITASLSARPR